MKIMVKDIVKKLGYAEDTDNLKFFNTFKDNMRFKEIHIDAYSENPLSVSPYYMLLLRTSDKSVCIECNNDRLIFKKNDKYKTHILNILLSKITESFYRISENYTDFIVNVQDVYYRISIDNGCCN